MKKIALIGNPNTGKTSLFNMLTKSYEYVGNWSGVTVEKKIGDWVDKNAKLIDFPGVYSLNPLSKDESVSIRYLLNERPDAILNIVDASQLERNLYLTIQLLEIGYPVVLALNMNDVAHSRGMIIHTKKLAQHLGVPVVSVVARKSQGKIELNAQTFEEKTINELGEYDPSIYEAFAAFKKVVPEHLQQWWIFLQFLEQNQEVTRFLYQHIKSEQLELIYKKAETLIQEKKLGLHLPQYIRSVRIALVKHICAESTRQTAEKLTPVTDKIDRVLTHRFWGLPIFFLFMFLIFKLTFDWCGMRLSDQLKEIIEGPVYQGIRTILDYINVSSFTHSLILDGIVNGVGSVLVFLPQILILFLFISFIEDSGYMARVTLVMDRIMENVGLNGKAFIPFILGFGCNVPAIMATRTVESEKERILTILLVPLMSCSARLPVYSLFIGMLFSKYQALVLFSLYILGIVLALLIAKFFSWLYVIKEKALFVIELPPYRTPQWKSLMRGTWEKGKGFLRKAGTFILGGSALIWLLQYTGPQGLDVPVEQSYLAHIGGFFAGFLEPLGFGTWQTAASLITGFLAKEIIISTMSIIYQTQDGMLQDTLTNSFTALQAYSFMVFLLLYIPCLATVGVIKKETYSWYWAIISIIYSLLLAYIVSFLVYQLGQIFGLA